MNTHKLFLILLALASLSCNAVVDEQSLEESPLIEYEGISICVSEATTRTAIDPDDMESVEWLSDDCIYLWAQDAEAESYSFEAAEFKQKYFHESYSQAVFIADVDPMSSGTYTYFGVYPKPTSVSGSEVSYTLSSEQSGLYDGDMDIMVANPITGGALSEIPDVDLALSFSHLTHAVRINIPDNRNLFGQGVRTLEVTFPGDVVGDLSFDAASNAPTPSLSNGSSVVTLNFEEELDEGDQYAWIFIAPTTLSGTLSFRAYGDNGYKSAIISVDIDKTMVAGSITPITLTVPSNAAETILNLSIKNNYLGEDIESMTITAPSGAQFVGGATTVTLPYNSNNVYSVSYYADDYGDLFNAGSLSIVYESEHAIVSNTVSLSGIGIVDDVSNSVSCNVPYLFEEDFSGISETGYNDLWLIGKDLPGLSDYWVDGTIYKYWAATSIAIRSYYLGATYSGYINLDLDGITGLKSSVSNITLTIAFKADWVSNIYGSMKLSVYNDSSSSTTASITLSSNSNAAYNKITTDRSVNLTYCNPTSTITWKTNGSSPNWMAGSGYDLIYIDDVKISIK